MAILKTTILKDSVLNDFHFKHDYVDSFQLGFEDKDRKITALAVAKAFLLSAPKWVKNLLAFRNKIVSVFGLKTPNNINNRERVLENFRCEPGEQVGPFRVIAKTENEVVLGEDDKHLDFRVSLFLVQQKDSQKILVITTTVQFKNWFGRLYFLIVKPFHKLIVSTMLKRVVLKLRKEDKQPDIRYTIKG